MATTLQFEGAEIDEKDIFCLDTGHILPGRPPPPSRIWDQQLLDTWRKSLIAVLPAKPSPLAQRFAADLDGRRAANLMLRYDYLPLVP